MKFLYNLLIFIQILLLKFPGAVKLRPKCAYVMVAWMTFLHPYLHAESLTSPCNHYNLEVTCILGQNVFSFLVDVESCVFNDR